MRPTPFIVLALFTFMALATVMGVKVFTSWDQVTVLWEADTNPLLLVGHPHMPRYLVAYPGFLLEEQLPGIGFSLYVAVFFAFNIALFRNIAILVIHRRPLLIIYLSFAAIHLGMNGRGVMAWTAWLICIWVCQKITMKISSPANLIGWITLSCLLATVSTGVFIVVIVAFTFILSSNIQQKKRVSLIQKILIFFVAALLCYLLINYFLMAIEKNIDFYGGGIQGFFAMLQHGLGILFFELSIVSVIFFVVIISFMFVTLFMSIFVRRICLVERFLIFSFIGGLFGFTVLTLTIPLLMLQIQKWISRPLMIKRDSSKQLLRINSNSK